jgi:hypothetical protein
MENIAGLNNSIETAIRYGLDDPGIKSQWQGGEIFTHLPRPGPDAHSVSCKLAPVLFSRGKKRVKVISAFMACSLLKFTFTLWRIFRIN